MANVGATSGQSLSRERWTQLIAGVICMTLIASLQYATVSVPSAGLS